MIFSSTLFLLYFLPIFLIVYFLTPKGLKNWWILIGSLVFYAWGAPLFIFILLGSTVIDFFLVQKLYISEDQRRKKLLLFISILLNVGLLIYFKYANFFIDNVNNALESAGVSQISWTKVVLPIGISFYTFQTLSYAIDIYRGTQKPLVHLHNYLVYILSFPQMIAGPIVRYGQVSEQLLDRTSSLDDKLFGFYRFCVGLAKKVLIANVLGTQAEYFPELPSEELTWIGSWVGILAFTFQIYFDFAGYSDMAIGLGKMMGFKFPENFNNPYNARSITDFWKRWHMTLGDWMRDYLYIPLGGNRVNSNARLYFNLGFVFLISGLWHGASWNFVIWGIYHGVFLILDRLFLKKVLVKMGVSSVLMTFLLVVIGWVFFAIEDVGDSWNYLSKMFSMEFSDGIVLTSEVTVTLLIAAFISFACLSAQGRKLQASFYTETLSANRSIVYTFSALILFTISLGYITSSGFNPFIYFRF